MDRPVAPAAERNRQPILDVLQMELQGRMNVLEIGSGTGQHAIFFAENMPDLHWQTSDLECNHGGINGWVEYAGLANVAEPLLLDMAQADPSIGTYDAVYSSNTAHIMSADLVEKMFAFVGRILADDGVFCLYGPFNENGTFTSDSNRKFNESLRNQDNQMGIRDIADLGQFADNAGMHLERRYAMPANNQVLVWKCVDVDE